MGTCGQYEHGQKTFDSYAIIEMNWRLFTLGLIIAVASSSAGALVGHGITLKTNRSNLEQMRPTLDKAIEKATNEITNEIRIDKIKKSDSLRIIMDPTNRQRLLLQKGCGKDSICFPVKNLTKRQKRRLGF